MLRRKCIASSGRLAGVDQTTWNSLQLKIDLSVSVNWNGTRVLETMQLRRVTFAFV